MSFLRTNALFGAMEIASRLPLVFAVGFLARLTGPEAFGVWVLILVGQNLLATVSGFGLSTALSRFAPSAPWPEARGMLLLTLAAPLPLIAVAVVAVMVMGDDAARFLGLPEGLWWLLPLGALLAMSTVVEGALDAFFKARKLLRRQLVFLGGRTILELAVLGGLYLLAPGMAARDPFTLLALYAALTITGRLMLYALLTALQPAGVRWPARPRIIEMLSIGTAVLMMGIIVWAMSHGDRLVVAAMALPEELGVYGFGAVLASYMVYLSYAVFPLMLPRAVQFHDAGDFVSLRRLTVEAQSLYLAVMGPGILFLLLFAPEIVALTGGQAYLAAAPVIVALALAIGIDHLSIVYEWAFLISKRAFLMTWTAALHAALRLGGLAGAATVVGVLEGVWAVPVATAVFAAVRFAVSRIVLPLPLPPLVLAGFLAVVAVLVAAALLPPLSLGSRLGLFAIAGLPPLAAALMKILTGRWPFAARQAGIPQGRC